MALLTDECSFRDFIVPLFHHCVIFLLLAQSSAGQSPLGGPTLPIMAVLGGDVILPCHLMPPMSAVAMTVEWTGPNSSTVHVSHDNVDLLDHQNASYKGRTSMSSDNLKCGVISLNISGVKLTDVGEYRCHIQELDTTYTVQLLVRKWIVYWTAIPKLWSSDCKAPLLTSLERGTVKRHCSKDLRDKELE
ncbi:butyrophilin subfamily 3 member A1-like [Epinephelus lanceolatus]